MFCSNVEFGAVQKRANLLELEKCCKTHILLQKSEPIQPKTSNILPKFCQPTLSDPAEGSDHGPPERRHRLAGPADDAPDGGVQPRGRPRAAFLS